MTYRGVAHERDERAWESVIVRVPINKHNQNQPEEKQVYFTLQSPGHTITEGCQGRNSNRAEPWRQELV